ncbi:MAG: DinB family protein [Chitinophagales bacterium]
MENVSFTSTIDAILNQLELQTRLFRNSVDGISDHDALRQMNTNTNHVAWLTGHIVSSRYFLASALGLHVHEPFPELFAERKGLQVEAEYPSQHELTKDWEPISDLLLSKLKTLTADELNEKIAFVVPTGNTMEALIAFISHHEAYTIGQIGLYRRYFGYPGMKYS